MLQGIYGPFANNFHEYLAILVINTAIIAPCQSYEGEEEEQKSPRILGIRPFLAH